jgi:predicted metal-binding membrane protein
MERILRRDRALVATILAAFTVLSWIYLSPWPEIFLRAMCA